MRCLFLVHMSILGILHKKLNLQSDGHGIANFQTMLSIGLGQEQQFSATSCVVKSHAILCMNYCDDGWNDKVTL